MEMKTLDRAKRIRVLKRMIIGLILTLILLPTVLCVIFFVRISNLQKDLLKIQEENAANIAKMLQIQEDQQKSLQEQLEHQQAELQKVASETEKLHDEIADVRKDSEAEHESVSWPRKVYLTFDDGPSGHTQDILDILDEYGVKGNFFVCATQNEAYLKFYKQILDEGHMLGLHSYTHEYDEIYASEEAFQKDVLAIRDFVKEQTGGFEATYYRFPGGSSNLHSRISLPACVDWLNDQGLIYYDWNISSQDATNPMQSVENIFHNATYGCEDFEEVVVLMHDLGNKDSTVEALPQIIQYYQDIGASISVIDENSMRIQHDK